VTRYGHHKHETIINFPPNLMQFVLFIIYYLIINLRECRSRTGSEI